MHQYIEFFNFSRGLMATNDKSQKLLYITHINLSNLSDQICYDLLPDEDCHDHCRPHLCTNQVKPKDRMWSKSNYSSVVNMGFGL